MPAGTSARTQILLLAGVGVIVALAAATLRSDGPGSSASPPTPERAAAVASTAGPDACADCHRALHPELVRAEEEGAHAGKATCADCHGTDHAAIFSTDGEVSSAACGRCHEKRYREFRRSRHGRLLKGGAMADTLRAHAFSVGGCQATNGCHEVQRRNADGSVGRCASCHPAHALEKGTASDPANCARCHSGPDHPQWEAWSNDVHGVLFRRDEASGAAPSCATCHMPGGNHDDSIGLTPSVVARDGQPRPTLVPPMSPEAHAAAREAMVATCARCHGARLSRATLAAGDDARFDALMLCEEAADIVRALDAEGLLVPSPKDRVGNPVAGGALALGGKQIYDDDSSVAERIFYEMFMFDFPALWRATYHTVPDLVRWTVREKLKSNLIRLREEARRLRAGGSPAPGK